MAVRDPRQTLEPLFAEDMEHAPQDPLRRRSEKLAEGNVHPGRTDGVGGGVDCWEGPAWEDASQQSRIRPVRRCRAIPPPRSRRGRRGCRRGCESARCGVSRSRSHDLLAPPLRLISRRTTLSLAESKGGGTVKAMARQARAKPTLPLGRPNHGDPKQVPALVPGLDGRGTAAGGGVRTADVRTVRGMGECDLQPAQIPGRGRRMWMASREPVFTLRRYILLSHDLVGWALSHSMRLGRWPVGPARP